MSYSSGHRRRRIRWLSNRRVDWRFFGSLMLLLGVMLSGVVLMHWVQTPKNAAFLLRRSEALTEKKEYAEAARYLRLYLRMEPEDAAAFSKLSLVLAEIGTVDTDFEAQTRLAQLLRKDPTNHEAQLALLKVSLRLGDKNMALHAAKALQPSAKTNSELLTWIGEAYELNQRSGDAIDAFRAAVRANPADLIAYQNYLALLDRTHSTDPDVASAVTEMLRQNGDSAAALLVAYTARRDAKLPLAKDALEQALLKDPKSVEVLLMAAGEVVGADPKRAGQLLEKAYAAAPKDPRVLTLWGKWLRAHGQESLALSRFREGFTNSGETDPAFAWRIAEMLIERRELTKLDPYFSVLLSNTSYRPAYLFLKGRIDLLEGRSQPALDNLREAASLLDNSSPYRVPAQDEGEIRYQVFLGLASANLQLGNLENALTSARRAHQLLPAESLPLATMGSIYFQSQDYAAAVRQWQAAIEHPPTPAPAYIELARSLLYVELEKPRSERRFSAYDQAVVQAERMLPDSPDLALLQAETSLAQGDLRPAIANLRAASQGHPDSFAIALTLCRSLVLAKEWGPAQKEIGRTYRRFGSSTELTMTLANLQYGRGDFAEAHKTLEAALKRSPAPLRPGIMIAIGNTIAAQGKLEAAKEQLQVAAALSTNGQTALVGFYLTQLQLEPLREVIDTWQKDAKSNAVVWRWGDGLLAAARFSPNPSFARPILTEQLSVLRETALQNWETAELSGISEQISDRPEAAIKQLWLAMARSSGEEPLTYRLVRLLLQERRIEDARDVVARIARQRFPNPLDERLAIEIALVDGEPNTAIAAAEKLIARFPKNFALELWYADLLIRADRSEDGIQKLRHLCTANPDQWHAWVALVKTIYLPESGNATTSLESTLAEISGQTPSFTRGMCYLGLGDLVPAEQQFEMACKSEPLSPLQWRTAVDVLGARKSNDLASLLAKAKSTNPGAFWLRPNSDAK